jgi:hypothetical protein
MNKTQYLIGLEDKILSMKSSIFKKYIAIFILSSAGLTVDFLMCMSYEHHDLFARLNIIFTYLLISFGLITGAFFFKNLSVAFLVILDGFINSSSLSLITQLLQIKIDEEGHGYLIDLQSEWKKSGLTKNQIKKKELIFYIDHFWGRFVSWIRLPRFLSSIITK